MYRPGDAGFSQRCRSLVLMALLLAGTALAGQVHPAQAAGGGTVTLSQALKAVVSSSHAAKVAKLDAAEARSRTRAVRSRELPSVGLTGGFVDRDSELVAVFGPFTAPLGGDTYWQYQVTATYLLWDGGVRRSSIEASRAGERVAERAGAAAVTRTEIEGLDAFLRAVGARARGQAVAKRIDAVKAHLAEVKDLFSQGMVARNDLLETQVRLRQVEDESSAAGDDESVATRTLARLMGRDPSRHLQLPGSLGLPPPLRWTKKQLLEAAIKESPEIRVVEARLEAAEKRAEVSRRDGMPQVLTEFSHTYEENPYLLYPNANVLFLGVRWNVFDGGARAAKRRMAGLETAKARQDMIEAKRRVRNQLDAAYRAYRRALREARTAAQNVASAEENLRIEEDQYKVGMVRTTDVLDAEALLAASRFELIARHESAYARQGRLLLLAGRDLAAFYRGGKGEEEGL